MPALKHFFIKKNRPLSASFYNYEMKYILAKCREVKVMGLHDYVLAEQIKLPGRVFWKGLLSCPV